MAYLSWNQKTIVDFSNENVNSLYNHGFVFTRVGKGKVNQTRSLRIDLSKFELSSENRRVLRKTENVTLEALPLPYVDYTWHIGKLAKDFYDTKFGDRTFTANKIKELMTDPEKRNFNVVLVYWTSPPTPLLEERGALNPSPLGGGIKGEGSNVIGYAICYQNSKILHYCYPFYSLITTHYSLSNTGLGMMLKALVLAKEQNKKYFYLGSFQRPTDTYKLQFTGLEWWDGQEWKKDLEELKNLP